MIFLVNCYHTFNNSATHKMLRSTLAWMARYTSNAHPSSRPKSNAIHIHIQQILVAAQYLKLVSVAYVCLFGCCLCTYRDCFEDVQRKQIYRHHKIDSQYRSTHTRCIPIPIKIRRNFFTHPNV